MISILHVRGTCTFTSIENSSQVELDKGVQKITKQSQSNASDIETRKLILVY
jgi:hypothetical protein